MKKLTSILLITCLTTLSSAICRAESVAITHEFDAMIKGTTLTWGTPSNYTIGYTDLVTYTGSGGGTFGLHGGSIFCINLPGKNSTMQIAPAVEDLTRLYVVHMYGSAPTFLKFYVSTDNETWTDVSSTATYRVGNIDVPMPEKGNYYIKIVNEGTSSPAQPINMTKFVYYTEPCHCLRVVVN